VVVRRTEDLVEVGQLHPAPFEPAQHLARGLTAVASLAVGQMLLPVVLGDEPRITGRLIDKIDSCDE
jgi:hypothetical protein